MTATRASVSLTTPNGVTEPGTTPRSSSEQLRLAEGKPGAADPLVQALHVDRGVLLGDEQEDLVLLVLEEEVLGVAAGDRAAQRLALLDGEERRVLRGRGRDAEPVEEGEKVGAGGGHRAVPAPCEVAAGLAAGRAGGNRAGARQLAG